MDVVVGGCVGDDAGKAGEVVEDGCLGGDAWVDGEEAQDKARSVCDKGFERLVQICVFEGTGDVLGGPATEHGGVEVEKGYSRGFRIVEEGFLDFEEKSWSDDCSMLVLVRAESGKQSTDFRIVFYPRM